VTEFVPIIAQIDSSALGISYLSIGPELVLAIGAALILMIEVFYKPRHVVHAGLVFSTLVLATATAILQYDRVQEAGATVHFSGMIVSDEFAVLGKFLLLLVAALGLLVAWPMVEELGRRGAEGVALVLLSGAGFMFMVAGANLMMVFLGLEIGSISLYVLAGITRESVESDEAALKYFLLGSFASAIFVYGVALAYAGTGELSLAGIAAQLPGGAIVLRPGVLLVAMAMLITGLLFKVTAAPFHAWAPDVYQGSPAGIVGYMATAAKVAGFATLARILYVAFGSFVDDWAPALAAIAAISVVLGTLMAIMQTDMRRLLAYSGVAHAGFIITGIVGGQLTSVWFYLAVYVVQLIAAFAVVSVIAGPTGSVSPLDDYKGLARRSPYMAGALTIMLLALAGMPATAGFIGKLGVFTSAWGAGYEWLVVAGLVASVAGFFFYIRIIVHMYMEEPVLAEAPGADLAKPVVSPNVEVVLAIAIAVTIFFGLYPTPLLNFLG
jgi:NADH-quinone oxidoreductase subunit N